VQKTNRELRGHRGEYEIHICVHMWAAFLSFLRKHVLIIYVTSWITASVQQRRIKHTPPTVVMRCPATTVHSTYTLAHVIRGQARLVPVAITLVFGCQTLTSVGTVNVCAVVILFFLAQFAIGIATHTFFFHLGVPFMIFRICLADIFCLKKK
jgi:hypothetical protein